LETNRRVYEPLPEYDLSGARALIVDRYRSYTRVLSELLEDFGIASVVAHSRAEALGAIRSREAFDVLAVGGDSDLDGGTVDLPGIARRHLGNVLVVSMAGCPVERQNLVQAGADVVADKSDCYRAVVEGLVRVRKESGAYVALRA